VWKGFEREIEKFEPFRRISSSINERRRDVLEKKRASSAKISHRTKKYVLLQAQVDFEDRLEEVKWAA